jgi:hypothetical protein
VEGTKGSGKLQREVDYAYIEYETWECQIGRIETDIVLGYEDEVKVVIRSRQLTLIHA